MRSMYPNCFSLLMCFCMFFRDVPVCSAMAFLVILGLSLMQLYMVLDALDNSFDTPSVSFDTPLYIFFDTPSISLAKPL